MYGHTGTVQEQPENILATACIFDFTITVSLLVDMQSVTVRLAEELSERGADGGQLELRFVTGTVYEGLSGHQEANQASGAFSRVLGGLLRTRCSYRCSFALLCTEREGS